LNIIGFSQEKKTKVENLI